MSQFFVAERYRALCETFSHTQLVGAHGVVWAHCKLQNEIVLSTWRSSSISQDAWQDFLKQSLKDHCFAVSQAAMTYGDKIPVGLESTLSNQTNWTNWTQEDHGQA